MLLHRHVPLLGCRSDVEPADRDHDPADSCPKHDADRGATEHHEHKSDGSAEQLDVVLGQSVGTTLCQGQLA